MEALAHHAISKQPNLSDSPYSLFRTLQNVWARQYADFFEGSDDLEEAVEEVLQVLGNPHELIVCQRLVYIGWAMALAAQPTIKYYFPLDARPDIVLGHVSRWINQSSQPPSNLAEMMFPEVQHDGFGGHQAADEAYQIFYNLLKSLEPEQTQDAILDILYDGLTGDAIIASSHKKRRLFNWWIIDVVPSAYYLTLPSTFLAHNWPFVLDTGI